MDDVVHRWGDVSGSWDTVLLGNGFSRSLSSTFDYDQLAGRAELSPRLRAILSACGTRDFERGLLAIEHTLDVLTALENVAQSDGDSQVEAAVEALRVDDLRDQLREGLIRAVHRSHPASSAIRASTRSNVQTALRSFRDVFTTNYDLLPYWCLMADEPHPIDYFWQREGSSLRFDEESARRVAGRRARQEGSTAIYYLHGALHLRASRDGSVMEKVAATGQGESLLKVITRRWTGEPDMPPLFVSEGSADLKLARIDASPYLKFALNQLGSGTRDVVVFGAAFHDQDAHVWRALSSGARRVAVSVYGDPDDDPRPHRDFLRRARSHLGGADVSFFWSRTHPLGRAGTPVGGSDVSSARRSARP
jgi:hypothetical protein